MHIVINNERQPSKEGLYFTIDSVGTKYITRFRDGNWKSQTGHPVEKWIDPETPTFSIEDMKKCFSRASASAHKNCYIKENEVLVDWDKVNEEEIEYFKKITRLKENKP